MSDAKPPRSQYRLIADESVLCCPTPDSYWLAHADGGGRRFSICFSCRTIGETGVGVVRVPARERRPQQEAHYRHHILGEPEST